MLPFASNSVRLDKLGSWVDPSDVVVNGSRTLHGIGERGVLFQSETPAGTHKSLQLTSLDAGLVSPGPRTNMDMYQFPGVRPAAADGVAFSLFNNIW